MRTFLTGATGHVGSAVLDAFLRSGHEVTALVRDPASAAHLSRHGVRTVMGDLSKPTSYASCAEDCDALVHTAYEKSEHAAKVDRLAVETLLAVADRRVTSGRRVRFVYTSAAWVLGNTTEAATEEAPLNPTPFVAWRPEHERVVLSAARGAELGTAVVRPGIVYGGRRGIIGDLLKNAANGLVRVVGDGSNHWPCVYDRDLADLYVRLATSHEVSGVFHANDQADERVDEIVEAIAGHARLRPDVRRVPLEEARAKMGPYADALALNQIIRSPRARAIGWTPILRSVSGNVARLIEEFRTAREAA